MEVELLEHTPNPDELAARCAWTCHRKTIPDSEEMDEETVDEILEKAISSGHVGVVEHVNFTFGVEGVSRVLTHQLVRHRIATYDQQSQRVVDIDMSENPFVVPESIDDNREAHHDFNNVLSTVAILYNDLMDKYDIPNEDARFVLPNATKTNITITMNARSLMHFFNLRCCNRAQWEIHEMAWRMLAECKKIAPKIFENAGPSCLSGECPEGEFGCGDPYSREDVEEYVNRHGGE